MPRYRVGDTTIRRKNLYMPCILGDRWDSLSDEEKVKLFKETWWADNLTEAEWRLILDQNPPGYSKVVKSRLKRKLAGWFMAMARVARFAPEVYSASIDKAKEMYQQQVGEEHPLFREEPE